MNGKTAKAIRRIISPENPARCTRVRYTSDMYNLITTYNVHGLPQYRVIMTKDNPKRACKVLKRFIKTGIIREYDKTPDEPSV